MFLLKAQWELFGLKAPAFSWMVSAVLVLYCIYVYLEYRRESRERKGVLAAAEKRLRSLQPRGSASPGRGMSRQLYEAISAVFDGLPLLQAPWQNIRSFIIAKTNETGEEQFWVSEEMGNILNGAGMIDSQSYKTAPTVISGIGLLATFLAILVALLDIRLTNNKVQGLDLLVQGLSGKFLSSVVAVACATLLIYAEKGVSRPVAAHLASLTSTLKNLVPRLVQAQVLSDLHAEISGQSKIFRSIAGEIASELRRGLNEGLGPAVERMASAASDLGRFMRESEAKGRESMTDQLALLLGDLGRSLQSSLERMAVRFNDALAAGGAGQFAGVSQSLSKTVALLQQMSNQLTLNQHALDDLVERARDTTAGEGASRQAQIEQLTGVVADLMARLEEKTGESMVSMEKALAAVTVGMSDKMMDLSSRIAAIVAETSEKSASKAKEVLDEAGSLSSKSAAQLAQLLERHSAELTKVEDLKVLLDDTIKRFVLSIDRYGEVTEGLRKVTSQVNMGIASLNQVAKSIRESQEASVQVSRSFGSQMESIRDFTRNEQEVWNRMEGSMAQYEKVFETVEGHARALLEQIARHLGGYSETTERYFFQLTSAADTFMSQGIGRLAGTIDDLSEQLDELQRVAAKMSGTSQAA
jgi:hypothetical protein